jgi:hypothetical protein
VLAKAEYAWFRANMSEAGAQRRLRVAGIQGGTPWRGNVCLFANANKQTCDFGLPKSIFIGSFFAAWQRMNIKKPTASARSSVSDRRRIAKNSN